MPLWELTARAALGGCRPRPMAPTFSQVVHIHDLALRDPAQVAPEVLVQLLLLPQLLEGSPGLGLLPLLGEFPAVEQGQGRKNTVGRMELPGATEPLLRWTCPPGPVLPGVRGPLGRLRGGPLCHHQPRPPGPPPRSFFSSRLISPALSWVTLDIRDRKSTRLNSSH